MSNAGNEGRAITLADLQAALRQSKEEDVAARREEYERTRAELLRVLDERIDERISGTRTNGRNDEPHDIGHESESNGTPQGRSQTRGRHNETWPRRPHNYQTEFDDNISVNDHREHQRAHYA